MFLFRSRVKHQHHKRFAPFIPKFSARHPIGKSLANYPLQGSLGPALIVDAKLYAIVVAEFKLSQIAMQMFLAAMLIDALHAALENREIAFQRVRMD